MHSNRRVALLCRAEDGWVAMSALGRGGKPTGGSGKPTRIRSFMKTTIVRAACWGLIPASLAAWIIRAGGLRDA
jgi:hypothetical protein